MPSHSSEQVQSFSILEASIEDLRHALDAGWSTSVDLVSRYLRRIEIYDGHLNSIPVLNRLVLKDAARSDDRRAKDEMLGPLEGIPFTVKDSYKVKGMTVASGSPAFQHLIANGDAFTVKRLRDAGAILIGKTNMPPMAAGGMQRGIYGRAESPYNAEYLTAAFASGSSNGSATATAASFAAFGMGEETVSSGRSPASNNGLVAYTPSRGVISIRGNWPLYATCDVVVPHTRTVKDMFEVLDVIVADDEITKGDFWRDQPFVKLPKSSQVRPLSYKFLAKPDALLGKRLAVPKMYIGQDGKISIITRQSILDLWYEAKIVLESLGATVVESDFPLMEKYDSVSINHDPISNGNKPLDEDKADNEKGNGLTDTWNRIERKELVAYAWDDFLTSNEDQACSSLVTVDWKTIFPRPPGSLPDRYTKLKAPIDYAGLVESVKNGRTSINELPGIEAALKTLEHRRKVAFEDWLGENEFDAILFPANADIGKADSDRIEESAQHTWQNGVMYSNGNRVWRHLGIPTVSVTMGTMEDTRMPVGLTFAGKAYEDNLLLEMAFAYENASRARTAPACTPELESDIISCVKKEIS